MRMRISEAVFKMAAAPRVDIDRVGTSSEVRAPPLTFDNLISALKEVKELWQLSSWLGVDGAGFGRLYDSDKARLNAVVEKFLLGQGHQPTWRRVIYSLDVIGEVHLADKIRSFGEPVHDPSFTTAEVTSVLESVKDWDSLLKGYLISKPLLAAIKSRCSTDGDIASEGASYYVSCYPKPSWTHLAGWLYRFEEFSAMEKCKPFLPLRDLTITTEKLVELFSTVVDTEVKAIALYLALPRSKVGEIIGNYHDPTQQRDAFLDLYTTYHPCPSWRIVAEALRGLNLPHQADVVERTYIQVSERTQNNFDEAMKEGVVQIRNGNSFMMGVGGSGKTLTLHAILKEKIARLRQSTPCVKKGVRAVAQYKIVSETTAGKPSFVRITDEQFSDMLSTSATYIMRSRIDLTTTHRRPATATAGLGETPKIQLSRLSLQPLGASLEPGPLSSFHSQPPQTSGFQKELLTRMNAGSKFLIHLDDKDLFDFRDSGGQSMFHEILPVFVDNTMFGFLTVKLNERLDHHPMVEYYASGERVGEAFRSPFSHLQIFRHCMRALYSTSGKCPKIAFIGTHKDLEYQCKDESMEAKNRKLLNIIPPQMRDSVISYKRDSLIFPINALNPGADDEAVLDVLRGLIMSELHKLPQIRIPLRYFGLEMAFQRVAKYQNKGVLSLEECFKEAIALHFTREGFMDALMYLKANKRVLYYEAILPGVVFTDTKILLDKFTEIMEHYLMLVGSESSPVGSTLGAIKKFLSCGIITREILSRFKSQYIPKLFEEDDLILLFEHQLIVAKVGEGEYLMSSLLREEAIPHPLSDQASQDVPSLLFYFGEDGPKLGVYCSLLSSLITDSKWKLLVENGFPVQLSRNQARFANPGSDPGFITITDSFSTHFQVDVAFPSNVTQPKQREICERVCPTIRETILAGIRKASRRLKYFTASVPDVAFFCIKHQATSLHPAIVARSDLLTCTTNPASVCSEITDGHRLWLGQTDHDSVVEGTLGTSDLRKIYRAAWDARTKWYNIGLELAIDLGMLDSIEVDKSCVEDRFRAMLTTWLKMVQPKPTLASLAEALRSPTVGCGHLAEQMLSLK